MNSKITVIGAGNGGQAISAYCASMGLSVCLYNRNLRRFSYKNRQLTIELRGAIKTTATISLLTDDIQEAVKFGDIIMVVTTATAHRNIAEQISPYLKDGQIIILNPGRTCGVLEFNAVLSMSDKRVYLAEAQTLVYACRELSPGVVNVIGVKDKVLLSGRTKQETDYVLSVIQSVFPCFIPATNLLETGLENIGAIFHPPIVIFNAASIERNNEFYFYRDMTPEISDFIIELDKERLRTGAAYNISLMPVFEWIKYAYPSTYGNTLCERMKNNPAYYDIKGPGSLFTRQLTEDIPTGLIPISELAAKAKVETPLMNAIITISSSLLGVDFRKIGRTLENMGLQNLNKEDIINAIS